jgi:BASS family bile acid:Na+ symporter
VRKIYPAAREWPKKMATATFGLWSVTLFIIAASAAEFFRDNPDVSYWIVAETAFISLLICAVSFGAGALLEKKRFRREASQSLGQKNTTLTIYLALVYAGPLAAMGVVSYVLWHNSYNAIQLFLSDRRKRAKRGVDGQVKY